jgi:hypothetical protein
LSRNEVKRIVSANYRFGELEPEHSPRALRVLSAWQQSFSRKPRLRRGPLKIVGPAPSFESLCRHHSGDIPFRVILSELLQRKSVRLVRGGASVSISPSSAGKPGRQRDLNTLLYAAAFLSEVGEVDRVLVRRKERVIVPSRLAAAYVEKATSEKVSDLLDYLPKIFPNRKDSERNRTGVTVFALVSRPKRSR